MALAMIPPACGSQEIENRTPARSKEHCSSFFDSDEVGFLLRHFRRVKELSLAPWADYSPGEEAVLLVGSVSPGQALRCVVLSKAGLVSELLTLSDGVTFRTASHWFYNREPADPSAPEPAKDLARMLQRVDGELKALLDRHGVDRALLLRVDPAAAYAGKLTRENFNDYFASPTSFRFRTALHESFRLNVQFPAWFNQPSRYHWPQWESLPARKKVLSDCYRHDQRVAAAHKAEQAALLEAFDLVNKRVWRGNILKAGLKFIEERRKRYALLAEVRMPSTAGIKIGCEEAEAVMELGEGVGSFVGYAAAIELGLMDDSQIRRHYIAPLKEAYFETGSLQLLVLKRLLPAAAMRQLTQRISASKDYRGGVFGAFADTVRGALSELGPGFEAR